jgi:hypothetical protein
MRSKIIFVAIILFFTTVSSVMSQDLASLMNANQDTAYDKSEIIKYRKNTKINIGQLNIENNTAEEIDFLLYHSDAPENGFFVSMRLKGGQHDFVRNIDETTLYLANDWGIRLVTDQKESPIFFIGSICKFNNNEYTLSIPKYDKAILYNFTPNQDSVSILDTNGNNTHDQQSNFQQRFVDELNKILLTTPHMDWKFEGKMKIDSMFFVDKNGMLSVTLRYITDSSFYKVRMEAPLNKIKYIDQDIYIFLRFKENDVKLYTSDLGNENLIYRENLNIFHIGEPADGINQNTLNEIQHLYKSIQLDNKK